MINPNELKLGNYVRVKGLEKCRCENPDNLPEDIFTVVYIFPDMIGVDLGAGATQKFQIDPEISGDISDVEYVSILDGMYLGLKVFGDEMYELRDYELSYIRRNWFALVMGGSDIHYTFAYMHQIQNFYSLVYSNYVDEYLKKKSQKG